MTKAVPGRPHLQIRVPPELRLRLEEASKRQRRSLTSQVILFLERSLDAEDEREERLAKAS